MQKRLQVSFDDRTYWNVVKGIAIAAMVLGHAIQYGGGANYYNSSSYFENIVFRTIYGFHMPLLIFVSGYLFAFSIKKYSLKRLCHKKMTSLLLPLMVNVAILVLLYESNLTSWGGLKYTGMHIIFSLARKFWFLWAVMYCMVFVIAIKNLHLKLCIEYLLALLGIIVFYLIPDTIVPNAELYKYMLPYFVLGFYLNGKESDIARFFKKKYWFVLMCLVVYAICIYGFHTRDYVYISGSYIFCSRDVMDNIFICLKRIMMGYAGIAAILACSFILVKKIGGVADSLAYFGKNSLGIYIFSTWCFDGLALHLYSSYNVIYILLTFVMSLVFSLLMTYLVEKNNITRMLLLGGR